MTCDRVELEHNSLFEAVLIYKDSHNVPVDLTGSVDDADFTIGDGDSNDIWVGSVSTGYMTPDYPNGSFTLLIPESVIDTFDFERARFRFRVKWITKGWQSIGDGDVIFND